MGTVDRAFFLTVLSRLGCHDTPDNLEALQVWQRAEGGSATFNPFNTTQPYAGASDYNSVGVKNYPSEAAGIDATVQTLNNGHYYDIVRWLRNGGNGREVCQAIDASVWGTHGATALWDATRPQPEEPTMDTQFQQAFDNLSNKLDQLTSALSNAVSILEKGFPASNPGEPAGSHLGLFDISHQISALAAQVQTLIDREKAEPA